MALLTRSRRSRDAASGIIADIEGDVSGQVAVGSHIVQVTAQHGAVVHVAPPERAPVVRARAEPAAIRPRDLPDLLGRDAELQLARDGLIDGATVAFHGPGGMGKSALLRFLCHRDAPELAHGIVFLRAAGQTVEDIAQILFEALYESDVACKPTPIELRTRLRDRAALVVLDDLTCTRDELAELLDLAPACRLLLTSERQSLWGEGRVHRLGGLAPDAALLLLERALGRPLADDDERDRASELCRLVEGRPLSILQAAALAREGDLPRADAGALERIAADGLNESERRVLTVLELLRPSAVHTDDVAAIAGVPDAGAVLERLRDAGIAQANSPRWNVTLQPGVPHDGEGELAARAIARLTSAAPDRSPDDVPAVLAALDVGADAHRWEELIAGGRAVDSLLALHGRWGAWRTALEHVRHAAQERADVSSEAWALHQLGTRAGCLGDLDVARPLLEEALALRRRLHEEPAAAVTSHNLDVLFGTAGGAARRRRRPPRGPHATLLLLGVVMLLLAAGSATAIVTARHHAPSHATPAQAHPDSSGATTSERSGTRSTGTDSRNPIVTDPTEPESEESDPAVTDPTEPESEEPDPAVTDPSESGEPTEPEPPAYRTQRGTESFNAPPPDPPIN